MNTGTKWSLLALGTAGVGVVGWIALRHYIRNEVLKTLNGPGPEGYEYDKKMNSGLLSSLGGMLFNAPTAHDLAISTVPLWGTNHPYDAFDDILVKGRKSKYWPKNRQSLMPAIADNFIFTTLKAMSEAAKAQEQIKQLKG